MTTVSQYVADFFIKKVSHAFTITGGGAMYLNDAFSRSFGDNLVFMHHEQSLSMASEAYARFNGLGVCQVTTGPGGINALAGCAGSFIDSQPIFFVSGQVESYSLKHNFIRQFGVQEVDICSIVKPIVKGVVQLNDPKLVRYELERLHFLATTGRPGPVWLDIPLDIQNSNVVEPDLVGFEPPTRDKRFDRMLTVKIEKSADLVSQSRRPILLIGAGSRSFLKANPGYIENLGIPVVTGWNGKDLVDHAHPAYLGSCGIFGNRVANLAVNEADLVIGIGYRFSVPQIGYDPSGFAPKAKKICVDIDPGEFLKSDSFFDLTIQCDAGTFLGQITRDRFGDIKEWSEYLQTLRTKYSLDEIYNWDFVDPPKAVNSFEFMRSLSEALPENVRCVTDMGTSFTCTHQVLQLSGRNELFTSSGLASMGFGLPGAIGAAQATDNLTVLVTGDGGLMFNLQELEVVSNSHLDMRIVLLNNDGYLTMKHMQKARFDHLVGSDPSTGLSMPRFGTIATAFDIEHRTCSKTTEIEEGLGWLLERGSPKQRILEVFMDPEQPLIPRVQTRTDDQGKLIPPTLADVFPFL